MKNRISRIFALRNKPKDLYVAFGGGIGVGVCADAVTIRCGDDVGEYEDLMLCTLKNEIIPNTDITDKQREMIMDSPYIHLLFNSVDSVEAMITSLQAVREKILAKSKNEKEI